MSRPNLAQLSPPDFEDLVRDLLRAKWSVEIESFSGGRDGGVDLRHTRLDQTTVVQCKHYARSTLAKLRSHLLRTELPKIKALAPDRYVLVTSLPLTPGNKAALVADLAPYVRASEDIMGFDEIAGLLRDYPKVERANYKLWINSTAVLERVVHAAEHCQTEFAIERIKKKLPLFVETQSYVDAQRMLDEHRVLVVAGAPGVGKTTLAEIVLYDHLSRGYEPVVIQASLTEGRKLYKHGERQIFYFDDFLGQTYFGENQALLGRNEDAALRDFVEMIQIAEHARFLLTTRDHILASALNRSERLRHSPIFDHVRTLRLSDYSFPARVRILFNHLYFSDLPETHIDALLEADAPVMIARHEHFNPRLIEWLSSRQRLAKVSAADYPAHVEALLKNPEILWRHAFEEEISFDARSVLLAVYTLGGSPFLDDLREAWAALSQVRTQKYAKPTNPDAYRSALQELDGAFLDYRGGRAYFINPSIGDYVAAAIANSPDHVQDLINAAVRATQVRTILTLSEEQSDKPIAAALNDSAIAIHARLSIWWDKDDTHWVKEERGTIGYFVDLTLFGRLGLIIELAEKYQSAAFAEDATTRGPAIIDTVDERNDMSALVGFIESVSRAKWFMDHGGAALVGRAKAMAMRTIEHPKAEGLFWVSRSAGRARDVWTGDELEALALAQEKYVEGGAWTEVGDLEDLDDLENLAATLNLLKSDFGLDLNIEIEHAEELIEERTKPERPEPERDNVERDDVSEEIWMSDDDVRDIFSTLRE